MMVKRMRTCTSRIERVQSPRKGWDPQWAMFFGMDFAVYLVQGPAISVYPSVKDSFAKNREDTRGAVILVRESILNKSVLVEATWLSSEFAATCGPSKMIDQATFIHRFIERGVHNPQRSFLGGHFLEGEDVPSMVPQEIPSMYYGGRLKSLYILPQGISHGALAKVKRIKGQDDNGRCWVRFRGGGLSAFETAVTFNDDGIKEQDLPPSRLSFRKKGSAVQVWQKPILTVDRSSLQWLGQLKGGVLAKSTDSGCHIYMTELGNWGRQLCSGEIVRFTSSGLNDEVAVVKRSISCGHIELCCSTQQIFPARLTKLVPALSPPVLSSSYHPKARLCALTGLNWQQAQEYEQPERSIAHHVWEFEKRNALEPYDNTCRIVCAKDTDVFVVGIPVIDALNATGPCSNIVLSFLKQARGSKTPGVVAWIKPSRKYGPLLMLDVCSVPESMFRFMWKAHQDYNRESVFASEYHCDAFDVLETADAGVEEAKEALNVSQFPPCIASMLPGGFFSQSGGRYLAKHSLRYVAAEMVKPSRLPLKDIEDMFKGSMNASGQSHFNEHYQSKRVRCAKSCRSLLTETSDYHMVCPFAKTPDRAFSLCLGYDTTVVSVKGHVAKRSPIVVYESRVSKGADQ